MGTRADLKTIDIAGRVVGYNNPCFVVAEAGVNHNGSLEMAHQLVDVAVHAGADAIKFQTFKTDRLVTQTAPKATYQLENTDSDETQYDMLRRVELSMDDHIKLMNYCQSRGILFMSTPFDETSADLLAELNVSVIKVPSGEITNLPFLSYVASKAKPLIVSTGMSNLGEVEAAVQSIEQAGNKNIVLLHCVSNYPADPADVNLRAMDTLRTAFRLPVGYSDHTLGGEVALAAVALGACVIEKHITLDKQLPGPDHQASLEPEEFAALVRAIRRVESALGDGRKVPVTAEMNTAHVARKSLVASRDLSKDTVLTEDMIAIKRPGTGLPPSMQDYLIGRTLKQNIEAGTPLSFEMIL